MALFEAHDVPCAPALTRAETIRHPQVLCSNSIIEYDHHCAGRLRQARCPGQFESTPTQIDRGAPRLGEHGTEIMRELGYDDATIERLRRDGTLGAEPAATSRQTVAA